MEVHVLYQPEFQGQIIPPRVRGGLDKKIPIKSKSIDHLIETWNSSEDVSRGYRPRISRDTHFICDPFMNIYKNTDEFFVGLIITVFKKPKIGEVFDSFFIEFPVTLVRNENGETFERNENLRGDCYLIFRTYEGEQLDVPILERRLEGLDRIKDANARLFNKIEMLERYVNDKYGQTASDQNSIILKLLTNLDARKKPKTEGEDDLKRMKMGEEEEEEEEGSVCVIV